MPNEWETVTALPPLVEGEIQLWRIRLDDSVAELAIYRQHLSSGELERAHRLREGRVRMQFVVARACIRVLLGNLLQLPPGLVPIELGAYGKPETPPVDDLPLFFNVAHSRETILIALCRSSQVGVDLEYLDRATETLEVAQSAFTADEFRQLEQIADDHERRRAFFRCWTCKEAVVKADGRGLSLSLNSMTVPVLGPANSTLVVVTETATDSSNWFVSEIELGDEIVGAFAVGHPEVKVERFNFSLIQHFAAG